MSSNIPILGQKTFTPSELYVAGECQQCGSTIFVHSPTPTQDPIAFPLCGCAFDGEPLVLEKEQPYDGDRERATLIALFNAFHQMRMQMEAIFPQLEQTVIEADSRLIGDEVEDEAVIHQDGEGVGL